MFYATGYTGINKILLTGIYSYYAFIDLHMHFLYKLSALRKAPTCEIRGLYLFISSVHLIHLQARG